MNFKKATDALCQAVSHDDLAQALGVSIPTVRQARLDPSNKAHRSAPEGWPAVVIRLAEARARRLLKLAETLRNETDG